MEHRFAVVYRLIILGSGPAGYTAAIYAGRALLEPLVITGDQPGGQLMLTKDVENFPGFPEGILGMELMERMEQQARRFGARIVNEKAVEVDFSSRPLKIITDQGFYEAEALIIATGASAKWLGLEAEARLRGRGVSACAVCDGPLFKGKKVVVVGGGDTALDDAIFLTKFAEKVIVVHRRDQLRASRILQKRAFEEKKIEFLWNSVVKDILGQDVVEGIVVENTKTGESSRITCQGVFVAIGHTPNTDIFKGKLELDERGYIITKGFTKTSVEGVFAAGDVCDPVYRQAITAAASGCMAALDAKMYLEARGLF